MVQGSILRVDGLGKDFRMHLQGGIRLPAYRDVSFELARGECLALDGPSGSGKSSLLRQIFGNYLTRRGQILLRVDDAWIDLAGLDPRSWIALRTHRIGYVSQFLRVVPRVSALEIVAEPCHRRGLDADEARARAAAMLERLALPERLWQLPPASFSGGEQQRVNIARGFIVDFPLLLLDEPTASLDRDNRQRVMALIDESRHRGSAVLGVFHDREVRDQVATRLLTMPHQATAA